MAGDIIQERRVFTRYEFREPVQFALKDINQFAGAHACDISLSGIRINLNEYFPTNTELVLKMALPNESVEDCLARVVWISPIEEGGGYLAGLRFSDSEATFNCKKKFHRFIYSMKLR